MSSFTYFYFTHVFTLDPENVSMDVEELEMELIDGGLEELEVDEEAVTIYCEYADFNNDNYISCVIIPPTIFWIWAAW